MAARTAQLRDLIRDEDFEGARAVLSDLGPVDTAEEFGWLDSEEQAIAFRLLPKDRALGVFEYLDPPHQAELLQALRKDHVSELFAGLEADDQARLLDEMPAKVATRLLQGLPKSEYQEVASLLGYPQDSAGRLMIPMATVLDPEVTREEAMKKLQQRRADPNLKSLERSPIAVLPVTDRSRRLIGMVRLADLIEAPDGTPIKEILEPENHQVTAHVDQEIAARLMQEADLLALPVVDDENRLLGIITVDDAMEVLEAEATEDAFRSGGSEPLNEPYLSATVLTLAKKRGVWLIVLILAAFLTINVMEVFESTLEAVVVLSVFVPMVIGAGGNAGSQAASSVVRALAVAEVRPRDVLRVIWREVRVGLMLGLFLGAILFPIITVMYDPQVAITISITVVFICGWACVVGGVLPLAARKLGVDPAVFSTPVVSTLVDATGLIIYFTVAGIIMADQIAAATG